MGGVMAQWLKAPGLAAAVTGFEYKEIPASHMQYRYVIMKRHHPSGAQKQKILKSRREETEALSGSMLKFVNQVIKPESIIASSSMNQGKVSMKHFFETAQLLADNFPETHIDLLSTRQITSKLIQHHSLNSATSQFIKQNCMIDWIKSFWQVKKADRINSLFAMFFATKFVESNTANSVKGFP
ncbi:hypothetical protein HELRODRAFT_173130 [Helobdella robusta]|uniref:Uncharacterized protein n=1 Tax=Helobdella robusta TaxID=6412 RepID=T1F6F1_HELRO|nr:hypothetical protein HELRODRAFT_173130 [Helobdella robusta]ESO04056.1 hypothetical protein HELRODRAFT_173130 [Helobdella robusta]